ncbi:hypothetical protein [uncultured Stenotrophomonas sp.]|uniref:hypothetical protein n=1 Tax=uncultured Stenotrophomonas sp. TaxID=165438 RepID=UPI0028EFE04C|nr:hypothetical protein [uncultured Stenotrophomonas sp.]
MEAGKQESSDKNAWYRNVKLLTVIVTMLLLLVGCSKPIYHYLERSQLQRWERAVAEEQRQLRAQDATSIQPKSDAVDFGRELDTLTGFYEVVISILLGVLALIAGLAFWTIKVVTKAQAEETALEAAKSILGGHDSFKRRLEEVVSEVVGLRMEEVNAKLEEFSVPISMVVTNPNQDVSKPKPHAAQKRARKKPVAK